MSNLAFVNVNGVPVNTGSGTTGIEVSAGSTFTISIISPNVSFQCSVSSTDGYNRNAVPATIQATSVTISATEYQFTFPANDYSGNVGATVLFHATTNSDPTTVFTFEVYSIGGDGVRSIAQGENQEGNITYGIYSNLNANLHRAGGGSGATSLSGDVTGSVGANTVVKLYGKSLSATSPITNNILTWSGTAWTPYSGLISLSGDATASGSISTIGIIASNLKVTGLQGNPIQDQGTLGAAQDGYVLTFSNGIPGWNAAPAQATTSGGDLTGLLSSAKVVGIDGYAITTPVLLSSATDGYVLTYTNATGKLSFKSAPSGSFAAGGDLSGTSSAQTVIGIDGYQIYSTKLQPGQTLQLHTDNVLHPVGVSTTLNPFSYGALANATSSEAAPYDNLGLQGAINAAIAGNKNPIIVEPGTYQLFYPVFIPGGNIHLEGSMQQNFYGGSAAFGTNLSLQGHLISDAIVVAPLGCVAPPIDGYNAGTGTVNLVNLSNKIAGFQPQLFFTECIGGHINGFSQITVQAWTHFNANPDGESNFIWIIGSSGSDGYTTTFGMTLWWNASTNGLTFQLSTTGGGAVVYSKVAIPADGYYHIAGTYDGSYARLFINGQLSTFSAGGNASGPVACTGTIIQEPWEDLSIGGGLQFETGPNFGQYPFANLDPYMAVAGTAMDGIGNILIDGYCRYTANFTCPTQNVDPWHAIPPNYNNVLSPGTTLACNFDTYAGIGSGLTYTGYTGPGYSGVINTLQSGTVYQTSIPAMVVVKTFTNPFNTSATLSTYGYSSWIPWTGTYAQQNASGIVIKNLQFTSTHNYGSAIRAQLSSGSIFENLNIYLAGRGITLTNNCQNIIARGFTGTITPVGSAQSWWFEDGGSGANEVLIDDFNVIGSTYPIVFSGASVRGRNLYIESDASGGSQCALLLQCQNGTAIFDGCTIGDDNSGYPSGYQRAGILFNAGSPSDFQSTTLQINGTHILTASSPYTVPQILINQAVAYAPITVLGSTLAGNGPNYQFVGGNPAPLPLMTDYNAYNETVSFSTSTGSFIPSYKILGYECQLHSVNFTSNAAMTLAQNDWLYTDIAFTDTHPYLTGTTTVNLPFINAGAKHTVYNYTAQTLILKWVGGTGTTGLSIGSRGSGTFTSFDIVSDGTNIHQTTAQFNSP